MKTFKDVKEKESIYGVGSDGRFAEYLVAGCHYKPQQDCVTLLIHKDCKSREIILSESSACDKYTFRENFGEFEWFFTEKGMAMAYIAESIRTHLNSFFSISQ